MERARGVGSRRRSTLHCGMMKARRQGGQAHLRRRRRAGWASRREERPASDHRSRSSRVGDKQEGKIQRAGGRLGVGERRQLGGCWLWLACGQRTNAAPAFKPKPLAFIARAAAPMFSPIVGSTRIIAGGAARRACSCCWGDGTAAAAAEAAAAAAARGVLLPPHLRRQAAAAQCCWLRYRNAMLLCFDCRGASCAWACMVQLSSSCRGNR